MSTWDTVTLREVAESLNYGVTAPATWEPKGPKFLRITDIRNGSVDWDRVPWCESGDRAVNGSRLRPGDIVFARTGSTGNSLLIRDCPENSVFASYLIRVRLNDSVDPSYMSYFLQTPDYWSQIASKSHGAIQSGVNASTLGGLRFPLPPLPHQQRIAAILGQVDSVRAMRREAISQLDELMQSIFLDMFGDPVRNTKDFPLARLGDLTDIGNGSTPSRKSPEYFDGKVPWVKTAEIRGGLITDTEEKISENARSVARCKIYPRDSILIALYGQGKTRGKCAILGIDAATNQACAVLSPSPAYETWFLFAQLDMAYLRLRALGRGGNQANLNLRMIADFKVIVPSLDIQRNFVYCVETIEDLKTSHRAHLVELDALFASLQYRAFRGEL